jgi:hypothetical protein
MTIARLAMGLAAVAALLGTNCSRQADSPPTKPRGQTYVTRPTLEPDKLSSIWLIKRHVDPEARFDFVDDARPLTNGIPFDTAEAEFRRYANISCFESILRKHPSSDPGIQQLGQRIHDLEINYWGEKRFADSLQLKREIQALIDAQAGNPQGCLPAALQVFDRWRASLSTPAP